ncbi:DUF5719 family protein [Actinotignum sp. GS-2025b]|uniref:DUF5719 family protein n=3 Tax=Actinotignum sp. GS-2025b TaxID=3427275 RepID=UPI003F45DA72
MDQVRDEAEVGRASGRGARWRHLTVRAGSALAVLGIAAAVAAPGVVLPTGAPRAVEAEVASAGEAPTQLLCGGGFEQTISAGMTVEGSPGGTAENIATQVLLFGTADKEARAALPTGTILSADPGEVLSGAVAYSAQGGNGRGLATNTCVSGAGDLWITASATSVGYSNQLLLTNPGAAPITVRVDGLGGAGPLGTVRVAVPGRSTVRHTLDGLLAEDSRLALHLSTQAGTFGATLQNQHISGTSGAGVDFAAGAPAATELTIPGIPEGSTLRIANPGEATTFTVQLTGEDGTTRTLPGGEDVEIAANSVMDLTLAGIDPGTYAVQVRGAPLLAAGVLLGGGGDAAWASPVAPAARTAGSFGPGPARLALAGRGHVDITPVGADGVDLDPVNAQVRGYATVELPEAARGYRIEAENPVSAAALILAPNGEAGGASGIDWVSAVADQREALSARVAVRQN